MIKKILTIMMLLLIAVPAVLAELLEPTLFDDQIVEKQIYPQQICGGDHPDNPAKPCNTVEVPMIDVVFVIDATGSMSDEILSVKTHVADIIKEVKSGNPKPDLRVGFVTYRDYELEDKTYVTREWQLTDNIEKAVERVMEIEARGGGDYSEAVADGLYAGITLMDWNENAKNIVFLIGDASPHGEGSAESNYHQGSPFGVDYRDSIREAVDQDIKIYTISGSGMDSVGVRIWKEIAEKTGGEYEHLNYKRIDVDQYYDDQGIEDEWVRVEAKKSATYDQKSNSFLSNTLGLFGKASIMAEAQEMGVIYRSDDDKTDDKTYEKYPKDDTKDIDDKKDGIDYSTLTTDDKPKSSKLGNFFRAVFRKIFFWK